MTRVYFRMAAMMRSITLRQPGLEIRFRLPPPINLPNPAEIEALWTPVLGGFQAGVDSLADDLRSALEDLPALQVL